jgi:hypothetical protein
MARLYSVATLVALSLAGGASQASLQDQAGAEQPSRRCLPLDRVISRTPQPPNHVRFEMADGTIYLSRPLDRCASLARAGQQDILVLSVDGTQVCSGDRVRIVDPAEARATGIRAFPGCRLGPFIEEPRP